MLIRRGSEESTSIILNITITVCLRVYIINTGDSTKPDHSLINPIILAQQTWHKLYPDCAGKFQSPVDLPVSGLIKVHGQRPLIFCNYAEVPLSMTMFFDGNRSEYHFILKPFTTSVYLNDKNCW